MKKPSPPGPPWCGLARIFVLFWILTYIHFVKPDDFKLLKGVDKLSLASHVSRVKGAGQFGLVPLAMIDEDRLVAIAAH